MEAIEKASPSHMTTAFVRDIAKAQRRATSKRIDLDGRASVSNHESKRSEFIAPFSRFCSNFCQEKTAEIAVFSKTAPCPSCETFSQCGFSKLLKTLFGTFQYK